MADIDASSKISNETKPLNYSEYISSQEVESNNYSPLLDQTSKELNQQSDLSAEQYPGVDEDKYVPNKFMGIELKPTVRAYNLIGAYLSMFLGMAILEFGNTFLFFLLQDENYFHMTSKEAAKTFGDIVFYTQFFVVFSKLNFINQIYIH